MRGTKNIRSITLYLSTRHHVTEILNLHEQCLERLKYRKCIAAHRSKINQIYSYGPPVGLVTEPVERPSTSRRTVQSVLSSRTRTVCHIVSGGLMSRPARCICEHPPSPLFLILICPGLHAPPFLTFAV